MIEAWDVVNRWIIQYGNRMGKVFRLNKEGTFAVKDDNDQEYVVDVPQHSDHVYFCAPIVTLNNDATKAEDMECVLKWNLWGQKTQGGTLSFEEATSRIVFHKIFKVEDLDDNSFREEFNRFIQCVDQIKIMWKEHQQNVTKCSLDSNVMPMFRA